MPPLYRQLCADRLFLLVHAMAILFWLGLYLVTDTTSGRLSDNPLLLLQLILLYPILEEIVFRGLLQGWLWTTPLRTARRFGQISMPNIVTSVIFTGLHFFYHPPLWAAGVFIPSLIYGLFRDRYGHLLPAIWLHIFFNSGYFLLFG
ncbi:MAG: JDVT-CTERM system glutamic-type intramembrane protease [Gammaproteobacteria bacterium]|nr:JDVT-CTERM system glutamic-type intramembrane protease [Gammaproteobacteria bacterium]MDH5653988.1 JDVT-CTERM system glutamic-type intramembrane protease [Gammaproteobacteria bacterium]